MREIVTVVPFDFLLRFPAAFRGGRYDLKRRAARAAFERFIALELFKGKARLHAAVRARHEVWNVVGLFVVHGSLPRHRGLPFAAAR